MRELSILFFFVTFFCLFPMRSLAEYSLELIPRISIGQEYDDNIYLDDTNERSDNLTTVSPGINMTISSSNKALSLDYAPTWVWYDKYDENDTVRHAGTVTFWQNIAERVRFDLANTYIRSEEPLETEEEVESARRTRYTYERNIGSASLEYQFGPEDTIAFGYRHSLLENEDPAVDDGTIQNPFATAIYWFDVKNGMELNYEFTRADFWRDDAFMAGDDYRGHATGIRYIHRFIPQTTGFISYDYTTRNFEGLTEDYKINEGALGIEHSFSPNLSLSLQGGAFTLNNERSDDETEPTYDASLVKRFERGSFTIGSRRGWDEAYLEAERRGLTMYWSANSRLEYRFMERLNGYAGSSFRRDRDTENREWETWRGSCGLTLEFARWFSLTLDYSHIDRDDDIDTEDYRVNRLMLILSASKLYRL